MMKSPPTQLYGFESFLLPWKSVASNSVAVIALRVSLMPWLLICDPKGADKEMRQMISEKMSAWQAYQQQLWQEPMRFAWDFNGLLLAGSHAHSLKSAMSRSGQRLAKPYAAKVNANRRRLSRTTHR